MGTVIVWVMLGQIVVSLVGLVVSVLNLRHARAEAGARLSRDQRVAARYVARRTYAAGVAQIALTVVSLAGLELLSSSTLVAAGLFAVRQIGTCAAAVSLTAWAWSDYRFRRSFS